MPIKYYLRHNPIGRKPNEYIAQVLIEQSLDLEAIIEKMVQQRGSSLNASQFRSALTMFEQVVCDALSNSHSINLSFIKIRPGIRGVFSHIRDPFNERRHKKKITLLAGPVLREAINATSVERRQDHPLLIPILSNFLDRYSKSTNTKLSPGSIGEIVGRQLKFNPENEAEGIYFLHSDGKTSTKVTVLSIRTEKRLIFNIPSHLPAGVYSLEVRKCYGKKDEPRIGRLVNSLVVDVRITLP